MINNIWIVNNKIQFKPMSKQKVLKKKSLGILMHPSCIPGGVNVELLVEGPKSG